MKKMYYLFCLGLLFFSLQNAFAQQTFNNFQEANLVIGQPDFTTNTAACTQTGFNGPSYVAISSKGVLAIAEQTAGRVKIWNSVYNANNQAPDIVIGKTDFTTCNFAAPPTQSIMGFCDGVAFSPDGNKLLVSDSNNNRVLIWNSIPTSNGQPADVVIGQNNFTTATSGLSDTKLNYPTGIFIGADGKLFVSDLNNNRVLVWNSIPTTNGKAADLVIGQLNFTTNTVGNTADKLRAPWGIWVSPDAKLLVAEGGNTFGNNRVLVWNSIPTSNGQAADVVIGHTDFGLSTGGTSASTLSIPAGVTVSPDGKVAIGEFGNNRVLIFNEIPTSNGASADLVLGQPDFTTSTGYNPGGTPSSQNMFRPYNVSFDLNGRLFVVGRNMHRGMVFGEIPTEEAELSIQMSTASCATSNTNVSITITNNGADDATGVIATASLPSTFQYLNHTASSGTYNPTSGYWNIGNIPSGSTVTLSINGDASAADSYIAYSNIIQSNQLDPDLSNNGTSIDFDLVEININPDNLSQGSQNAPYTQTLTQTGLSGEIIWAITAGTLPSGITLNPSTGEIAGTPTEAGVFNITVEVSNGSCSNAKDYSIEICPLVSFSPAILPDAIQRYDYSQVLTQTGFTGSVIWSVVEGELPPGLSLFSNSGAISGSPTQAGIYEFTVQVSSGNCSATQTYTLEVVCPDVAISPETLPAGVIGIAYDQDINQTGFNSFISWAIVAGQLPTGLSMSTASGRITGIPTEAGIFNFTIQVSQGNCSQSKAYSIEICPIAVFTPSQTALPSATQSISYTQSIESNLTGTLTWSATGLPSGLSIDSETGIISGTPEVLGDFNNITVSVTNGICSGSKTYTLNVQAIFTNLNISNMPSLVWGSLEWGDYDNDGDLDLLASGTATDDSNDFIGSTVIYRNNGNNTFTDINANLQGVYQSDAKWGDYDNDGDLDIAVVGIADYTLTNRVAKIYRNDNGVFVDISASLQGVWMSSVDWGDYDNDGDLDLFLTGSSDIGIIAKIYQNNEGNFTDTNTTLDGAYLGSAEWGDYDGDGDLDIAVCGRNSSNNPITKVYNNVEGAFTEVSGTFDGVAFGSVSWGDYDNDGDLDLLVNGLGNGNIDINKIYKNEGGTFIDINANLEGLNSGNEVWGDYDNDGDLDILLTGSRNGLRFSGVYQNNGNESFSLITANLVPAFNSVASWGDFNNDNKLDLAITGSSPPFGNIIIFENNANITNTAPNPPTALSASSSWVNGGGLAQLSWDKPTDGGANNTQTPQDALSYNIRIGTTSGGEDILSPMSNTNNGYRKIVNRGNSSTKNTNIEVKGLSEGTYYWSVQAIDHSFAGSDFASEGSFVVCAPISISPTDLENAIQGNAYSQILSQTGIDTGVITWLIASGELPTGLSLNQSTGEISGIATSFGVSTFAVEVSNGNCSATQSMSIEVICPSNISISPTDLADAIQGNAYSQTLTQTGINTGTLTWSVVSGELPTGLSLNQSTGEISGIATGFGVSTFTVEVSNGNCSATQSMSIEVICPSNISISPTDLEDAIQGNAYSQTLSQTGINTGTLTWSVVSGELPTGLSLNQSTGEISGIATSFGVSTFTVEVSNGNCSTSQSLSIEVICPSDIMINPTTLPNAIQGGVYSQTLTQTGINTGTVTWEVISGELPTGLSLNQSTGEISGIATSFGVSTFTIEVSNSNCSATQSLSIEVICPSSIIFEPIDLPNASVGQPYEVILSANALTGNLNWSINTGSLPNGMSLEASTGKIIGTATLAGSNTFSVSVSNGNCSFVSSLYTLVVERGIQTISFSSLEDKFLGDEDFDLVASASSGLAVSFTSSETSVASLQSNTVSIQGLGTTTITASQAGDENYLPASEVVQTLSVGLRAPSNLTAIRDPEGSVTLSWTDVIGENSYTILRSSNTPNDFQEIGTVGENITSYADEANIDEDITYFYVVRAENGAFVSANSNQVSALATALEDHSISDLITISPNPASSICKVNLGTSFFKRMELIVIHASGKVISTLQMDNIQGEFLIDVSTYASGTYFIQIKTERGTAIKRLVKQ